MCCGRAAEVPSLSPNFWFMTAVATQKLKPLQQPAATSLAMNRATAGRAHIVRRVAALPPRIFAYQIRLDSSHQPPSSPPSESPHVGKSVYHFDKGAASLILMVESVLQVLRTSNRQSLPHRPLYLSSHVLGMGEAGSRGIEGRQV